MRTGTYKQDGIWITFEYDSVFASDGIVTYRLNGKIVYQFHP